jgi:alpha-glucoside transport system substrate-binding protein
MRKRFLIVGAAAALIAQACSAAATQAPVVQPTPITITAPPVVQPTPIVITAPPASQPTPIVITPAPAASATAAPSLAPAVPATPTGYAMLDKALGSDKPFAGKTVDIQTQWIGGEGANFAASLADFQAATGIVINIEGVGSSHETVLRTRIEGNSPPDLAFLAQPSAVVAYGQEGKLVDLSSFMSADEIKKLNDEHSATINLLTDGTHIWGAPYKVDVKSTVWYPIKAFAAKGYQVPQTWDDLIKLSDQIVADGSNPWCIGMEAGTATGWQATDWLEEVILKTKGVDFYNNWISHQVKWTDPAIKAGLDNYDAKIYFTPNYVYGGVQAITATHQTDPMDPMFPPASAGDNWDGFTPGCWMQKQATWYGPDFFPDVKAGAKTSQYILGQDIGIFEFPAIDSSLGQVVEGSGDTLLVPKPAQGDVRPEVEAVAEFLSTPEGTERWIQAGSAISANSTTPSDWYAGAYKLQVAAQILQSAKGFGFDASDLMPAVVGSGAAWSELTDWINGGGTNPSTDDVLNAIEAAYPK